MIIGPGWKPISPTVLIISGLFAQLDKFFPGLHKVYSPELSFDEGLIDLRESKVKNAKTAAPQAAKDFPILLWSREALKVDIPFNDRNQRDVYFSGNNPDKLEIIATSIATLPISFMLIANTMNDIEVAELVYLAKIRGVKQYDVDYGDYGKLSYNINWGDMTNLTSSRENASYITVSFECEINGPWLLFTNMYPRLKQILIDTRIELYTEHSTLDIS